MVNLLNISLSARGPAQSLCYRHSHIFLLPDCPLSSALSNFLVFLSSFFLGPFSFLVLSDACVSTISLSPSLSVACFFYCLHFFPLSLCLEWSSVCCLPMASMSYVYSDFFSSRPRSLCFISCFFPSPDICRRFFTNLLSFCLTLSEGYRKLRAKCC